MIEAIQQTAALLSAISFVIITQYEYEDFSQWVSIPVALVMISGTVVFVVTTLIRIWS